MQPSRILIMGAAGRDFHNFNVAFRANPAYQVVAFTAAQIPNIAGRRYPPSLAGPGYPEGIPIFPENDLDRLVRQERIDQVVFAYSDVAHVEVMHQASRTLAAGGGFWLLGPRQTELRSTLPVVSVGAVRTGAGKSQVTRHLARILREFGYRVAPIRHPMPYGDLARQAVQRFTTYDDLERHQCTVEEREEYEPLLDAVGLVYAGVDYQAILRQAEQEADVILWDGGNNDLPFVASNLHIVVADPQRAGQESSYHPGEANARRADVIVINKVDSATAEQVIALRGGLHALNPAALMIEAASPIKVADPSAIRGRRVLVVEDGPTLTHGGLATGAGWLAARRHGAAVIVDPRPYAAGALKAVFAKFPNIGSVLPAMGYGEEMTADLQRTINDAAADLVLVGTPIDLGRFLKINKPTQRVRYELQEIGQPTLAAVLARKFPKKSSRRS